MPAAPETRDWEVPLGLSTRCSRGATRRARRSWVQRAGAEGGQMAGEPRHRGSGPQERPRYRGTGLITMPAAVERIVPSDRP